LSTVIGAKADERRTSLRSSRVFMPAAVRPFRADRKRQQRGRKADAETLERRLCRTRI